MNPAIRTCAGVPALSMFANGDGTPIVIDTTTDVPYYVKKNVITSLQQEGVRGGIRKTTDQTIGNLGATWVPIINYINQVFVDHPDVDTDLANGTIAFHKAGQYMLFANIEMGFTSDNNSSRKTGLRLFNVTDNAAIPNANVNLYAGAYSAGFANSTSIPVDLSPALVGKNIRIELGGGDTFAAVVLRTVILSAVLVGSVL
jgi:hypothetical protein